MARTGRSFPSTPIVLHGRIVPAAPTVTRPAGVQFVGQVDNLREARQRRDTTLIQINQSRIAAAPIPTSRLRQPIVILADHTRLPRQPLERITITHGVVAPAAPPPTPRIIQPIVVDARGHRPSSAKTQILHAQTTPIVRPPQPILVGFSAERRPATRYRTHITILKGAFAPVASVVTKPAQIVALTRLPRQRRGRAQITIQHGRVFVAPSGPAAPITTHTGLAGISGRTAARGLTGGTDISGASGILGVTGSSGLTDATGSSGRTN